jgi:hypothetical protein
MASPIDTPASGAVAPVAPSIRSSQPVRRAVPAAARSISSMAAKCERVGLGWPTDWTAARWPAFHIGSSGARPGCRPKVPSPAMTWLFGRASDGRAL